MAFCAQSQFALFLSVFLSCVSFAIVMPSMWPYLQTFSATKPFLAWVVASYSIGEASGALLFGRLGDTLPTRRVMLAAAALGSLGSALYVLAQPLPLYGPALILTGRFAQGMWTGGAQALQPAYLAAVLPEAQLTPAIVAINAYACLGFVVGPVFGLVFDVVPDVQLAFGLRVTELTAPGYFVLASALFTAVLFVGVFDEEGDRGGVQVWQEVGWGRGAGRLPTETEPLVRGEEKKAKKSEEVEEERRAGGQKVALNAPLVVCNVIFFVHFFGFALQETITTPIVQAFYNWSTLYANLLFTAAGVCALLTFLLLAPLSRHCSDRLLTAVSVSLGLGGYAMLVSRPWAAPSVGRFLGGFALISVAFPMGRATTISLYTKLLPLGEQGVGQGVILAVGAVARVLGPFWAVQGVEGWGRAYVFGGTGLAFGGCLALMAAYAKQLRI